LYISGICRYAVPLSNIARDSFLNFNNQTKAKEELFQVSDFYNYISSIDFTFRKVDIEFLLHFHYVFMPTWVGKEYLH
jgi:hypothetical protein